MTQFLQEAVSEFFPGARINAQTPVSGGDINQAFALDTSQGKLFVKVNSGRRFPGMFETEAQGLSLLKSASSFRVPHVFGVYNGLEDVALIMEFLENGSPPQGYWEAFGETLAIMHQTTNPNMGLDHNNYIGSLPQVNLLAADWNSFFMQQRLLPLARAAMANGMLNQNDIERLNKLEKVLPQFFPVEPPALLHGDLWSGNAMCLSDGLPSIFDPAVYYGHRLMDLGMTRLFGGFEARMYEAYHAQYPLPSNWQEGVEIANLYPLLVHINLFGASYVPSFRTILNRFTP